MGRDQHEIFTSSGIELIFALSPQAKGRVEKLFKTLQDRLVKELRLRQISNIEQANHLLVEHFIPAFNQRFAVEPREEADFHRILTDKSGKALRETLCRIDERLVQNDFTVSFRAQWYQLLPTKGLAMRPKDPVTIREYPDATLSLSIREKPILFEPISKRTVQLQKVTKLVPTIVPN